MIKKCCLFKKTHLVSVFHEFYSQYSIQCPHERKFGKIIEMWSVFTPWFQQPFVTRKVQFGKTESQKQLRKASANQNITSTTSVIMMLLLHTSRNFDSKYSFNVIKWSKNAIYGYITIFAFCHLVLLYVAYVGWSMYFGDVVQDSLSRDLWHFVKLISLVYLFFVCKYMSTKTRNDENK